MSILDGKTILLTGGTGSFGKAFTQEALENHSPRAVRILSRDELKQDLARRRFGHDTRVRFMIGDIRDRERVYRAMEGVDILVHAAALKQVPACEYNPFEAVKTNILGAQNLIGAALDRGVPRVVALSTDKAVNPVNLYGATKLCMEKMFIQGNSYRGGREVRMSCVRYGNVVGSRGSVIPFFLERARDGVLPITDERMTRFWITLPQAVRFVVDSVVRMVGGEVFIPKLPSVKITDLAHAIGPECRQEVVGIRPGEKLHESLLTVDESRHSLEYEDHYVVEPEHPWWGEAKHEGGKPLPDGFSFTSGNNSWWLEEGEIRELIAQYQPDDSPVG